jgi:hypothetical protein
LGVVVLAAIALAALLVEYTGRDSPERGFQDLLAGIDGGGICTEPRLWHAKGGLVVVKCGPPSQTLPFTNIVSVACVPDSRPWWERIRDEFRYQKRKRGW